MLGIDFCCWLKIPAWYNSGFDGWNYGKVTHKSMRFCQGPQAQTLIHSLNYPHASYGHSYINIFEEEGEAPKFGVISAILGFYPTDYYNYMRKLSWSTHVMNIVTMSNNRASNDTYWWFVDSMQFWCSGQDIRSIDKKNRTSLGKTLHYISCGFFQGLHAIMKTNPGIHVYIYIYKIT